MATTPWDKGNNGATVASKVVIVDGGGQYATHIQGVDSNTSGDLGFYDIEVGDAAKLEVTVTEGNVIEENENGCGFVAVGSRAEERRVGEEGVSTGRSRGTRCHEIKNKRVDKTRKKQR